MSNLRELAKARGKRHVKNNIRYKDKSKIPATPSSAATVRLKVELESNWDRYKPLDEDAGVDYAITDFAILANAPPALGSHFQFKSDKTIASSLEQENFQNNELFNLDLNLLNASLNTIPFNERYGFEREMFTESELKNMELNAEQAKETYSHILKNTLLMDSIENEDMRSKLNVSNKEEDLIEDNLNSLLQVNAHEKEEVCVEDDLDLLLQTTSLALEEQNQQDSCNKQSINDEESVNLSVIERTTNENVDVKKDVDLEQWLEDILDE